MNPLAWPDWLAASATPKPSSWNWSQEIDPVAVVALGISALTVIGGVISFCVTNRRAKAAEREAKQSNQIAKKSLKVSRKALRDTRKAKKDRLWADTIEAVHRVIGIDPLTQDLQKPLQDIRVSWSELVDGLTNWDGLDKWIATEQSLGAMLAQEAMYRAKPATDAAQRFDELKPFIEWASALIQNLRRFRTTGYDHDALKNLRQAAEKNLQAVCARNQWPSPVFND